MLQRKPTCWSSTRVCSRILWIGKIMGFSKAAIPELAAGVAREMVLLLRFSDDAGNGSMTVRGRGETRLRLRSTRKDLVAVGEKRKFGFSRERKRNLESNPDSVAARVIDGVHFWSLVCCWLLFAWLLAPLPLLTPSMTETLLLLTTMLHVCGSY